MHAVGGTVGEHGRRAPRPCSPSSRSRECSRQDRREVRAPGPCSRALRRHAPRASASEGLGAHREHVVVRSRDTGSGVCTVAPWQTRHSPRRPPRRRREPAASCIEPLPSVLPGLRVPLTASPRAHESRQSDVGLVPAFVGGPSRSMTESSARSPPLPSSTRRSMPCTPWASRRLIVHHCPRARDARCHARRGRHGRQARSASTVGEHGGRAPRPCSPSARSRECTRQVRGEVRAPGQCSRALKRHAPRRS
jgi:hypothetical protein